MTFFICDRNAHKQDPWDKIEHILVNLSARILAARAIYHRKNRYMYTFNLIRQISILFSQIRYKKISPLNLEVIKIFFASFSYSYLLPGIVRFLGLVCGRYCYPIFQ